MEKEFMLVMTASVNPNGMEGLSLESVVNREEQYINTLLFYAKQDFIKSILFVENSNWPLEHIKNELALYSRKMLWLSLDDNNYPRSWGKGYGEFLLMDKAIEHLGGGLSESCKNVIVVKVTGRFPILNIKTMLQEFLRRKDLRLAIDIIDHRLYDIMGLRWRGHCARTVMYAVTLGFYQKNIMGRYKEIPSKYWDAEELMFAVWKKVKGQSGIYPRFKHEPLMSGVSGSRNTTWLTANNYQSLLSRSKRMIRQMLRVFLPWIWL